MRWCASFGGGRRGCVSGDCFQGSYRGGWVNEVSDTGRALRDVMSRFATGVTVVAAVDREGSPFGLTVSSFTSVSLEPPLILVCIDHGAASHDPLMAASHFTVNILGAAQSAVADRFATEPSQGRFDDVSWSQSALGTPLVDGSRAWLECSRHEIYDGGDHSILLGRVEAAGSQGGPALLFHQGRYGSSGE